jgi:sugar/nucleoside kinase (ribokinase family)
MQEAENGGLVVAIGSALVDILVHETEEFRARSGAVKGGMTLVAVDHLERTLAATKGMCGVVPGGSACNTAIGIARLGGAARFIGKRGLDPFGDLFEEKLRKNAVEAFLFRDPSPTGRVLSIITPDAQRSMLTFLGAAAETRAEEISETCFSGARIVHVEGYLVFNRDLILTALEAAKRAEAFVSLDLASFTIVEQHRDFLAEIIERHVDILLANEDEARVFTGLEDEDAALEALSEKADLAVLKIGSRGSLIAHNGKRLRVAPLDCSGVVDTTGAGDLWASGFLYGLVNGFPLDFCGALGSFCGAEVCRVFGAAIPAEGWERINGRLAGFRAGNPASAGTEKFYWRNNGKKKDNPQGTSE